MQILPVRFENRNSRTMPPNCKVSTPQVVARQGAAIYSVDLHRSNLVRLGMSNAHSPNFKGVTFETTVIKEAVKTMFPKLKGVYTPDSKFVDLKKITYENLLSEKFDITKATKNKRTAYRFFLALLEGYAKNPAETGDFATQWVRKYNPDNMSSPLALLHFLSDFDTKETIFAVNRGILKNPGRCKSLDVPVFDSKGNFTINGTIFDTETTGTKVDKDRIVQLGALVIKKGKISRNYDRLVNPEMPIPEGASAVNGIFDKDVKGAPTLQEVANDFLGKVLCKENGIIVTWNGVKFDVPLLNRVIREIRIADNISEGHKLDKVMMERPAHKVLDVQILHQRLHPFLGASKKLSQQYHWLFCKPMQDAHDALSDCRGTMSILEYDCRMLNKHRIDKSKPLTLRQILQFQNGEPEVPNIDIKLGLVKGFNTGVRFDKSYRKELIDLANYFKEYNLSREMIYELKKEIGSDNIRKLEESGIINSAIDDTYKGNPLQAAETKKIPKTNKKRTLGYEMRKNLDILFDIAGVEGYGGKTKKEIRALIAQRSMTYTNTADDEKLSRGLWIKNVNPDDVKDGNDVPDDEIAVKVMESAKTNGLLVKLKKK